MSRKNELKNAKKMMKELTELIQINTKNTNF